jgi:hypothetical protein
MNDNNTIRAVATAETPQRPTPDANIVAPGTEAAPPPPVPTAPVNPQAQAAAPAVERVPPPPPTNPMMPRRTNDPTSTTGPGLEAMLQLVSGNPHWIEEDMRSNTFLPSFINVAATIDTMNAQMITTKKFTESSPQWHPLVSHLYFALCFYVRTFECMQYADQLSSDQTAAYLTIRSVLNTEQMLIPGLETSQGQLEIRSGL